MKYSQKGLIVASDMTHALIEAGCKKAYKVTSWQNDKSPKTQASFFALMRAHGLAAESVFDAAHGRRYLLFVYATREGRKECWDVLLTGGGLY